mgnify:CR=1 FL=1
MTGRLRTAMHKLVTQHIEPSKQDRQDRCSVLTSKRRADGDALPFQFVLPVFESRHTIMVVPEWREDVAVIEQHTNFLGEPLLASALVV